MIRWALPAAAFLGVLLATSGSSSTPGYPTGPPAAGGRAFQQEILGQLGTPSEWSTFLEVVAYGESRFDPGAQNTTAGEAAAAARAYGYSRGKGRLADSPWPESAYTWGSGGWYGMLPAYAVAAWRGTDLENLDPREVVHDPILSTIAALEYARRVMAWAAFDGTWLSLRVGWANPSKLGDPAFVAKIRGHLTKHLQAIGVPPSWMHGRVRPMTGYPGAVALYEQTRGAVS